VIAPGLADSLPRLPRFRRSRFCPWFLEEFEVSVWGLGRLSLAC
jgi:hypothetical protein